MYFKKYILILKNLGPKMSLSRKRFLVFKMSSMSLRKKIANIEKTKISFEKENEELKKKNE